jgi:chorismate dehydratase
MDNIRIACVRYVNTKPLIYGLDRVQGLTLLPAPPASIADMVVRREADLGLASIVDAVNSTEKMALFPVGMIGCDGPTLTVRVFSRVPFDKVTALAADTESHTSVILAQLILRRTHAVKPAVKPFNVADTGELPETILLIGDKVITGQPPEALYPHQIDLGLAWAELTKLPFVYAMWMARADRMDDASVNLAASLLDRQRVHNSTRMDHIARVAASQASWPLDVTRRYLTELLRYEVDGRAIEAVSTFITMAADEHLIQRRELTWAAPVHA